MGKLEKIFIKILRGNSDTNISFRDLCHLLESLGFELRIKGSHHIFTKENIEEILNLQPKGRQAKAYQVKQTRNIIIKYGMGDSIDE